MAKTKRASKQKNIRVSMADLRKVYNAGKKGRAAKIKVKRSR